MSNVVSFDEFCLLRRCPRLPGVGEIKRAHQKLVAEYGSDLVKQHLRVLADSTSDPRLCRRLVLFFFDAHPVSYIAKLERASFLSVKRSLVYAMKDVAEKVAVVPEEEADQPLSSAFA